MTNLNEKKAADDFLPMSKKAMKRRDGASAILNLS